MKIIINFVMTISLCSVKTKPNALISIIKNKVDNKDYIVYDTSKPHEIIYMEYENNFIVLNVYDKDSKTWVRYNEFPCQYHPLYKVSYIEFHLALVDSIIESVFSFKCSSEIATVLVYKEQDMMLNKDFESIIERIKSENLSRQMRNTENNIFVYDLIIEKYCLLHRLIAKINYIEGYDINKNNDDFVYYRKNNSIYYSFFIIKKSICHIFDIDIDRLNINDFFVKKVKDQFKYDNYNKDVFRYAIKLHNIDDFTEICNSRRFEKNEYYTEIENILNNLDNDRYVELGIEVIEESNTITFKSKFNKTIYSFETEDKQTNNFRQIDKTHLNLFYRLLHRRGILHQFIEKIFNDSGTGTNIFFANLCFHLNLISLSDLKYVTTNHVESDFNLKWLINKNKEDMLKIIEKSKLKNKEMIKNFIKENNIMNINCLEILDIHKNTLKKLNKILERNKNISRLKYIDEKKSYIKKIGFIDRLVKITSNIEDDIIYMIKICLFLEGDTLINEKMYNGDDVSYNLKSISNIVQKRRYKHRISLSEVYKEILAKYIYYNDALKYAWLKIFEQTSQITGAYYLYKLYDMKHFFYTKDYKVINSMDDENSVLIIYIKNKL
ncbi:uncharacterized protein VNE69_09194 [Vairimorpha necatrix]|uniref:Uncharacterized protein n=1 Tax=Vairimorpha necatrix TaxID=6039 RepID=A0AAX4JF85_9MICR